MPSLEQQRAQFAWEHAKNGVDATADKYRNLAKAAPALIMNNGLMQTLAYYNDKDQQQHRDLSAHLRRWLMKRESGNDQDPGFAHVMEILLQAQPDQYRRLTNEALLILRWIRQFASAV